MAMDSTQKFLLFFIFNMTWSFSNYPNTKVSKLHLQEKILDVNVPKVGSVHLNVVEACNFISLILGRSVSCTEQEVHCLQGYNH